jgi:RNA ligase
MVSMNPITTILQFVKQHGPDRKAYEQLGHLRAVVEGEYLLLNYTAEATYERAWNAVERVSRGLIIHWPTATLAARPFEKFFNLGEMPETMIANLPTEGLEVTVKLDGSLGIGFWHGEQYRIATRGSFSSEQAQWATAFVQRNYDTSSFPRDTTLLFEIIYPQNQIVINYRGEEALYIIGAITLDGYDYPYAELQEFAARYGFKLVAKAEFPDIPGLLELAASSSGVEGWVLRYPSGLRVKVKTSEYLKLHRLVTNLSPARVRDALLEDGLRELIKELPEEFRQQVETTATFIENYVAAEEARLRQLFSEYQPLAGEGRAGRKAFATAVVQNVAPANLPYMFALLDDKPIRPTLIAKFDLTLLPQPVGPQEDEG